MKNKIDGKTREKRLSQWPKLVLAGLVMGFCVFVGIWSIGLFWDNAKLIDPLNPATYNQARLAMDTAYAKGLFAGQSDEAAHNDPTKAPAEKTVDTRLKDAFVDLNGIATGTLGKRELNGIIKLDNGYITAYLDEKQDISHQVAKTVEFAQYVEGQGKRFVFVMAPHLIDKYNPMLPVGVVDYFNETADEFLQAVEAAGVMTLDLRAVMQQQGFDHYGGFFHTDHHWTPPAAAWANDQVMRQLQAWGWLAAEKPLPTPAGFAVVHEGVSFYGTAAQRTGEAFAGAADALYCLNPTADTPLFTKRFEEEQYSSSVPFEAVYRDWQYADYSRVYGPDAYYLYKTSFEMNVLNENAPSSSRLMLVCDSFGVPFQSFAASYVRQLTCFDGRSHPDLALPVEQSDIVMVLFNPSSLDIRTENQTIFNFR